MSGKVPKTDYSRIAKLYDKVRAEAAPSLVSRIITYGNIGDDSVVLDVGCGTGKYTMNIVSAARLTCALDPSIEMLEQAVAKDKSKRVHWIRGDGQRLPFADKVFTCAYMTTVIHHVEDKEMALREAHRVLRKGGICVIMTFSHSGIKKHILRHFPGVLNIDLKRIPSVTSMKRMMTAAGFGKVCYHVAENDEGYVSTNEYLERVRKKYVSTLTLLSEEEFQGGFRTFKQRLKNRYGKRIRRISRFVFIVGDKRPNLES